MKITAFVPIKLNNERLPGKNTKAFDNGKPLLCYILDTLNEVKGIDDIYLFCSSEEVCEYLPKGVKFLKRSIKLDDHKTTGNEIYHSFAKMIASDYYLVAQCTSPFIKATSIQRGVDAVLSNEYDSAFSVTENHEFLWFEGKPNYDVANIPRTQDMEPFYIESCAFWIFKREHILEANRRVGTNPAMIGVDKVEAVDIDNPVDFEIANAIFNSVVFKEKQGDTIT